MNQSIQPPTGGGRGFLVVQVTTANGAIPLENAAVTIRQTGGDNRNVLFELRSGSDGRTERVALAAPPRSESIDPDNFRPPYAVYNVEVSLPQYGSAVYDNVPIFDGITAIQQAVLAPLPEAGYGGSFTLNDARPFDGTLKTP